MKRALFGLLLCGFLPSAWSEPPGTAQTAAPVAKAPPLKGADAKEVSAKPRPSGKTIDHVELDQTTITGNRELPNVMVIVPWKESTPGSVSSVSQSLLDEALAPLDREEFRRELQYREAVRGSPAPARPAPNDKPSN